MSADHDRSSPEPLVGDVSRETLGRLQVFVEELKRWQRIKNLVGPRTLDEVWQRHIADSLQLLALNPGARRWLDLGSGAGFPGLVVAIAGGEEVHVDLVESNGRKCAFLRHVARSLGLNVKIHNARLEVVIPDMIGRIDVVSARALAPLTQLLAWTQPLLTTGVIGLFPKGREAAGELTDAEKSWRFSVEILPSRTDSAARILRITDLKSL